MPPVTVRPATLEDVAAINALYNHEIRHGVATWDEAPWPFQKRLAWFNEHQRDAQPVLVAVEPGGDAIGFASLTRFSGLSGYRYTRENTIIITPERQGQGVGRQLLSALIEEARRLGLRLIVASVTTTNESSMALHRNLGYEDVGVISNAGFKFGEWLSTRYLQLDLGPPAGAGHEPGTHAIE